MNLDLTLVRDYVYNEDSCESNCLFNYVFICIFLNILAIAVLEYSVRHKQQHGQLSDSVIIPIYLLTIE